MAGHGSSCRKTSVGFTTPKITAADLAELPTVPCVSLGDTLANFGVRHVDLFSLDVEGAEVSVLKTIDFSKFSASVIVLEIRDVNRETL